MNIIRSLTPVPFYFCASFKIDFFAYWFNVTKNYSLLVFTVTQACIQGSADIIFISFFIVVLWKGFIIISSFSIGTLYSDSKLLGSKWKAESEYQILGLWLQSLCLFQLHNIVLGEYVQWCVWYTHIWRFPYNAYRFFSNSVLEINIHIVSTWWYACLLHMYFQCLAFSFFLLFSFVTTIASPPANHCFQWHRVVPSANVL